MSLLSVWWRVWLSSGADGGFDGVDVPEDEDGLAGGEGYEKEGMNRLGMVVRRAGWASKVLWV